MVSELKRLKQSRLLLIGLALAEQILTEESDLEWLRGKEPGFSGF